MAYKAGKNNTFVDNADALLNQWESTIPNYKPPDNKFKYTRVIKSADGKYKVRWIDDVDKYIDGEDDDEPLEDTAKTYHIRFPNLERMMDDAYKVDIVYLKKGNVRHGQMLDALAPSRIPPPKPRVGGSKVKYTESPGRALVNGKKVVVFIGPRGGRYYESNGKYVKLRQRG